MTPTRTTLHAVRRIWHELDHASRRQIELLAELPPDRPVRTRPSTRSHGQRRG